MFYFFDRAEKLIESVNRIKVKSASQEEVINGPDILRVVFNMEPVSDAFYIGHKDVLNPNELCLYKIHTDKVSPAGWAVTGLESAYDDLMADGYIKDLRPSNKSVGLVLGSLLTNTRWLVGSIQSTKTVSTSFYYETPLEAIQKLLRLTGTEIKFRLVFDGRKVVGRYVDIYDAIGEDRGKRFVHGSNLLHVIREEKHSGIYTALVGQGRGEEITDDQGDYTGGFGRKITFKDVVWSKAKGDPVDKPKGEELVEIPEMTSVFGYPNGKPRVGLAEFPSIEDPGELLQATYDRLVTVSRPLVSYEADVEDVGDTGLGDIVSIVRKDLGIAYKTRINKRVINLLEPTNVKVELGDEIRDFRQQQIAEINDRIKTSGSVVRDLLNFVVSQYLGEDGYTYNFRVGNEYDLPAGIYSFNKPIDENPSNVIYIGAGKMLIANEKNPDGSWRWTTVATGDGFIAENMFAESLTANLIRGGLQTSLNDRSWVDWNLGTFNFRDRLTLGADNVLHMRGRTISEQSGRKTVMEHGQYKILNNDNEVLNISNYVGDGSDAHIILGAHGKKLEISKSTREGAVDYHFVTFDSVTKKIDIWQDVDIKKNINGLRFVNYSGGDIGIQFPNGYTLTIGPSAVRVINRSSRVVQEWS